MKRRTILIAITLLFGAAMGAIAAENSNPDPKREFGVMSFRCVKTAADERVEVTVGDLVFQATNLTFIRDGKSNTEVSAQNGQVRVETDTSLVTARSIKVSTKMPPLFSR